MKFEIQQAEYHRNGVGGEGFYTGLFTCDDPADEQMLCVFFPEHDEEGEPCPAGRDAEGQYVNPHIAILSVNRIPTDGVTFARNSWRGDYYLAVADAIVHHVYLAHSV